LKREVVRIEHAVTKRQGMRYLNNLILSIAEGEVVGMVTINQHGLEDLIELLRWNIPLEHGKFFFDEQLTSDSVMEWKMDNKVTIIDYHSRMIPGMTVADHLFTLRKGFKKFVVRKSVLEGQSEHILKQHGIRIRATQMTESLSILERCQIELVRATMSGVKLIILRELGKVMGEDDLVRFFELVESYAKKGIAFLYISSYPDEAFRLCSRLTIYDYGQVVKILYQNEICDENLSFFLKEAYLEKSNHRKNVELILEMNKIHCGNIVDFSCKIFRGECLTILDRYNSMLPEIAGFFMQEKKPSKGQFIFAGENYSDRVLFIPENATEHLLFHSQSYMYNLCFLLDKKIGRSVVPNKMMKSLQKEWAKELQGKDKLSSLKGLSIYELYDLVYYRVLLYRPDIVVIYQPFMGTDTDLSMRIIRLITKLQEHSIAVVVLTSYLAGVDLISNQIMEVKGGVIKKK